MFRLLPLLVILVGCGRPNSYHRIEVLDQATGRGVPLVSLISFNAVPYVTDSNGLIAFHEPHLMGREVFFEITGHGYEPPVLPNTDLKGFRITPTAGGH